jgi:hypothetical protein
MSNCDVRSSFTCLEPEKLGFKEESRKETASFETRQ